MSVCAWETGCVTTPSGINKGLMEAYQVITVDLAGRVLAGEGQPTSEIRMHLLAYELRPDISAVVHAHLPYATACTLAGIDLREPILPEVVITLGGIPTTPYATPGGPKKFRRLSGASSRNTTPCSYPGTAP